LAATQINVHFVSCDRRCFGLYQYTWWAQLASSEKLGRSFVKGVIKKFFPYFHSAIYTFNKNQERGLEPKSGGDLRPISIPDLKGQKPVDVFQLIISSQTASKCRTTFLQC